MLTAEGGGAELSVLGGIKMSSSSMALLNQGQDLN